MLHLFYFLQKDYFLQEWFICFESTIFNLFKYLYHHSAKEKLRFEAYKKTQDSNLKKNRETIIGDRSQGEGYGAYIVMPSDKERMDMERARREKERAKGLFDDLKRMLAVVHVAK